MLEHSYSIVTTNVFPFEKQIRRFLVIGGFILFILFFTGIVVGLLWDLAIIFVIVAFILTQISKQRVKEIGVLHFLEDKFEAEISGGLKTNTWVNVQDVSFSKLHSKVYKLSFDEIHFLLKLTKTELMDLEDFLESKDLMEDTAWPFYHR